MFSDFPSPVLVCLTRCVKEGSSLFNLPFFRSYNPLLQSSIRSFNGKISPYGDWYKGRLSRKGTQVGERPRKEAAICGTDGMPSACTRMTTAFLSATVVIRPGPSRLSQLLP